MTKALLIVPHFWDPVCVPLGVSSLKSYAEKNGHTVHLLDLNTEEKIFSFQHIYFQEYKRQFPRANKWNIERNGTEMLAMHQVIYLNARRSPRYTEMVSEVLNISGMPDSEFMVHLNIKRFDQIFHKLYLQVSQVVTHELAKLKPDVVGASLFNSTWAGTLFMMDLVKTMLPKVRTIVGGPGPIMGVTADIQELQHFYDAHESIDFYVVGEGEQAFLNILDNPTSLPMVVDSTRSGDRALNMNELPCPDYGELSIDRYMQLSISSSRGCPFECSFCAETVFWDGYRKSKFDRTYEHMNFLANKCNRQSFYLCDSLSNSSITQLTSKIHEEGKSYVLDCYLRADKSCTNKQKAINWRKGGLYRARLGMESASQRILDEMVKMTTPDLMSKSLEALAGAGVMTSTLWIVGYPGETEAEFKQT